MGETKLSPLPCPAGIPEWMWREVSEYDLPLTFTPTSVLDIGANIGAFSMLARERWPQATIYAYEPMPDNRQAYHKNFPITQRGQVFVFAAAVRGFNGTDKILVGDRGVTCGFHNIGRQTANTVEVKVMDAASLPAAEFVKIDTEGCELEIVQRLNLAETKVLCVEYHFLDDVPHLKHLAELNDLKLHLEKPLGDTWGILIFARAGAIAVPSTFDSRPSTDPKVFVALPVYGALDVFFTQSLIKFLNEPPCPIALRMNPGDSLVSRSRNTLTADFLETDCTHLLFIDTDLIFSAEQVARLLSHDKDIVAGFYPKKQEGPVQWVCNAHLGAERPIGPDGLQEVRYMGTGFLLVKRGVFERMMARYPELAFKADHRDRIEHDFWSVGVYRDSALHTPHSALPPGRYLSEDWLFCQRALDCGFQVWGDTRVVLKHVGQAIYPLRSQEEELKLSAPAASGNGTPVAGALRPSPAPAPSRCEAAQANGAVAPDHAPALHHSSFDLQPSR